MYQRIRENYPLLPPNLKSDQEHILRKLLLNIDVITQLPTGFGKSFLYSLLPYFQEQVCKKRMFYFFHLLKFNFYQKKYITIQPVDYCSY